jgi:hypothetical protein
MAFNLADFIFTKWSDLVLKKQTIINDTPINSQAGSDIIVATVDATGDNPVYGIENSSTINTAQGNDFIVANAKATSTNSNPSAAAYGIIGGFSSTIDMGEGNDVVTGNGIAKVTNATADAAAVAYGIIDGFASSTIDMGEGNDVVTGNGIAKATSTTSNAVTNAYGISNETNSTIDTGKGNDVVTGNGIAIANANGTASFASAVATGIQASPPGRNSSTIETGEGNDVITGKATAIANVTNAQYATAVATGIAHFSPNGRIDTGKGDDVITGIATAVATNAPYNYSYAYGIQYGGTIETGEGNDIITGIAVSTSPSSTQIFGGGPKAYGISGFGTISSDGTTIDYGKIDMGSGDDQLIGSSTINGVKQKVSFDSINVNMGAGNDLVSGFGAATIAGGSGVDVLNLGSLTFADFNIIGVSGSDPNHVANFIFNQDGIDITMNTTGFETFVLSGVSYAYKQLV